MYTARPVAAYLKATGRPALPSDAGAVFELLSKFATSYVPQRAAFDTNYLVLIEASGAGLLVAERGGSLLGYALASDANTLFANGIVTELLELYVEETERRRGLGRELVERAAARAKGRGAVEVTVPTRRARSFYLALGFEATAEYFKRELR